MILNKSKDENQKVECALSDILSKFKSITKSPEIYLKAQNGKADKSKNIVKTIYDYAKCKEHNSATEVPTELFVDDMDEEQIWQQLELQNNNFWSKCLKQTSKLLSGKESKFCLNIKIGNEQSDDLSDQNSDLLDNEEELSDEELQENEEDFNSSDENDFEESDDDEQSNNTNKKSNSNIKSKRTSIVDDEFFKLSEMEQFLEQEDRKEMQKQNNDRKSDSESDIDYFNGDFSDDFDDEDGDDDDEESREDNKNAKYSDFFADEGRSKVKTKKRENKKDQKLRERKEDLGLGNNDEEFDNDEEIEDESEENMDSDNENEESKNDKKVKFDLSKNTYKNDSENDEEYSENDSNINDEEIDDQNKSSFEQRQERLRQKISDLEETILADRPWQLKGEIDSISRPQNSLLEEILEFNSTSRPAPVITEEATLKLEDIIKQRIKDKAWNDVERKYKPEHTPQEFRKRLVLDQEKSKESLAQIYEKEYLKEVAKLKPKDNDDEDEPESHKEIRKMMKTLFASLDALSHFYYTPKVAVPEVRIIKNTPAINMEEVAPVAMSDAQLLAPEDVKPRSKGDIIGVTERTKTDKNRERRQKKIKQKHIKVARENRDKERELRGIKSSKREQSKLVEKLSKNRNVKKIKETETGKSLKSSKAFFSQLEETTTVTGDKKKKKRINDSEQLSAKRFKL